MLKVAHNCPLGLCLHDQRKSQLLTPSRECRQFYGLLYARLHRRISGSVEIYSLSEVVDANALFDSTRPSSLYF